MAAKKVRQLIHKIWFLLFVVVVGSGIQDQGWKNKTGSGINVTDPQLLMPKQILFHLDPE
jgi:hypothetical protein